MRICRATSVDVDAIRAVVEAAYAVYIPRIGRPPGPVSADYAALVEAGEVWVGISDRQIVGVLVVRADDDDLELENVAVDPPSQGQGYGRALIAFAEQQARELELAGVQLYTNEAMVENLRLYPRLGFVETERRVENGYRRVFFRKSLDAREQPS
jgi:ribosomal protein S18 acetylase RimI-like enzyme